MKESYKYYSNSNCEHMPCHKIKSKVFNCMFCYCPLYPMEDCGGDFIMLGNIKDCSGCIKPHTKQGYDFIQQNLNKDQDGDSK